MAILIKDTVNIMLTGGGTGGHMYPLLAVADWLREKGKGAVSLYFAGEIRPEFRQEFEDRYHIRKYEVLGSKIRRYFDFRNFIDIFKFFIGLGQALFWTYIIMPDVVFSKGGPGSLPVLFASRWYRIPVVIHESDAVPSMTTRLSMKYAKKIGVSFEETLTKVPEEKAFVSGNPIRKNVSPGGWLDQMGGKQYFKLNPEEPVLLVMGGSQGSVSINNLITDNLAELLKKTQIIHQVGASNMEEAEEMKEISLKGAEPSLWARHTLRGFMNEKEIKIALSSADIVLSRAGSSAIFEIAAYGKPSILVPLTNSAGDHQKINAYAYAETGAAIVMEEANLTPHILINDIEKLFSNPERIEKMKIAAKKFSKVKASETVGKEILRTIGIPIRETSTSEIAKSNADG
jgi:UDP-N-acetylglucosamine--N-acetylmuramyl-(pentapeptide) pyrophosphoryl-undecaprenol N-acetylglucosamine transferase